MFTGNAAELAKSLLLETTLPVCEIASRSGFEDDRYFSRLFRERIGKLPSEFRAEGKTKYEILEIYPPSVSGHWNDIMS